MKNTTITTTISEKGQRVGFVKVESGIVVANFTLVKLDNGKYYLNNPSYKVGEKFIDHAYIADKDARTDVLNEAVRQYEKLQA